MILTQIRRPFILQALFSSYFRFGAHGFCSRASTVMEKANGTTEEAPFYKKGNASTNFSSKIPLSPLFPDVGPHLDGYNIEVVDNDIWQVSSGLAHEWQEAESGKEAKSSIEEFHEQVDDVGSLQDDSDFDEIDNMRIRGNLFYKLDRDSKEFEEYSFDFHRKKSWERKDDPKGHEKKESSKKNRNSNQNKRKENLSHDSVSNVEKLPSLAKDPRVYSLIGKMDSSVGVETKKIRTPTFNQLTGSYHEPFCLDIYISKASVRACIIHRVTSKVVAVAHSISKDLKFDLVSTKNAATCAAVGEILAHRALADDIHDVVYTPRKGDRLEGKLHIVLQAIISSGINVKVKLKQRKPSKKAGLSVLGLDTLVPV